MTTSIRVASFPGEAHVAVVRDGQLIEYALWRPGAPDGVGDVLEGRVTSVVPAMAGAFVAVGAAEGFLPDSEGAKGLGVGTVLPVRITRSAQGGKGPRLTAKLPPDVRPGRGPNPVQRFGASFPGAEILVDDPALAATLGARFERGVLEDDVADAIAALAEPVLDLPTGARLSIWPTPALVAIDVDAAGALAAYGGAHSRHQGVNKSVLPPLAAQIRLRNLSGAIIVDLAGLPTRKRVAFAPDFAAALASDPLRPKFLGFTALGLAEIVRPRVHPPLHELLASPLAAGLAALRAVLAAGVRDPRQMPTVRAHPAVVSALRDDPVALADMARRAGRDVALRSDPSLPDRGWMLEKDNA